MLHSNPLERSQQAAQIGLAIITPQIAFSLFVGLLIEGKQNNFYICEMKYQKLISTKVIAEVKEKIAKIKLPKYSSRRPVLIYAGELDSAVIEADYFDIIYDLEQMDN
jgi:hypothetical protein